MDAAEGGPCKDYGDCDEFNYSLNDIESLQRGASTYLNYCYGCHSLQYSRWGRVATDLKIPEELFFDNLVFDNSIHESTGGQPTATDTIEIEKIAKACNYKHIFKVSTKIQTLKILRELKKYRGPILILIKIEKGKSIGNRINKKPKNIRQEFSKNL